MTEETIVASPNVATILIVDDNPRNLQVLGNMMEAIGYDVAMALNGTQALAYLEEDTPDLVLLDIMMPDIDGYEVCRRMKKMPGIKDIPVIFLTARVATADIVRGFEAGAVDYVTKPFQSAELLARVKTHLELKRAREEIVKLWGIIPICSKCSKLRDDKGYWQKVDSYLEAHSHAQLSHSLCPGCAEELYPTMFKKKSGTKNRISF